MISIVIPTKNSEKTLENCLNSITSQDIETEIIIVDCLSNDGTIEVAKKFGARFFSENSGLAKARNTGFSHANGDKFVSIDSDMILEDGLLAEIQSNQSDAMILTEYGLGSSYFSKCKSLEKKCYIGDLSIESIRVFSKKTYLEVEGYNPELLLGEDWDISQRVLSKGFSICRSKYKVFHNTDSLSLFNSLRKYFAYGKSLNALFKIRPDSSNLFIFRNFFFIKYFNVLIKDPIHAFGLLLFKPLEFFCAFLGYLFGKFSS